MTDCLTCISSTSCSSCYNGKFLKFDHTACVSDCLANDSRIFF